MLKVKVDVGDALKELNEAALKRKLNIFTEKLAQIGLATAQVGFGNFKWTEYEGGTSTPVERSSDTTVRVEPIENGYAVIAEGMDVLFVEFGAGVYYNGSESYPGERPSNIAGIGQYGKGHGSRDMWGYKDGDELILTHGNMPAAAMYYAKQDILRNIEKVAKEVFG